MNDKLTSEQLRDSFKYLYPAELPALKALVRDIPTRKPLVVNIGAGAGTSGLAIIESRPDVRLVTIDITDLSSPLGCLEAERQVLKDAGLFPAKEGRHWQICMDSGDAAYAWKGGGNQVLFERTVWPSLMTHSMSVPYGMRPDMVFVDGDHSYEHAYLDIALWLDILKEDGVIAVHDYAKSDLAECENCPHPMPWPGVDKAVDVLLLHNQQFITRVDSLIAFRKVGE